MQQHVHTVLFVGEDDYYERMIGDDLVFVQHFNNFQCQYQSKLKSFAKGVFVYYLNPEIFEALRPSNTPK